MGSTEFIAKIQMALSLSHEKASELTSIIDEMIIKRLNTQSIVYEEKKKIDITVEIEADRISREKAKKDSIILTFIRDWKHHSVDQKNEFTLQEIIDCLSKNDRLCQVYVHNYMDFLDSDYGCSYLESESGKRFLDNAHGKSFLFHNSTWLASTFGQNWLASSSGQSYLKMRIEKALEEKTSVGGWCKWFYIWLCSERGLNWLVETDIGKRFAKATQKLNQVFISYNDTFSFLLSRDVIQNWLQTDNGRTFLGSDMAFNYLITKDGVKTLEKNIAWLDTTDSGHVFKKLIQTKLLNNSDDIKGSFVKALYDSGLASKFFDEQDKKTDSEKQDDKKHVVATASEKQDDKAVLTDSEKQSDKRDVAATSSEKQDDKDLLIDWETVTE